MHTHFLSSFAISSCEGSVSSLVTNDPLEVSPPARQDGDRHPYPPRYRAAFAFSSILCPAPQQRALRLRLPHPRRADGFILLSCDDTNGAAPAYYTGSRLSVCPKYEMEQPTAYRFGQSLNQRLWLFGINGA